MVKEEFDRTLSQFTSKGTIKKMERQHTEGEKIFANHVFCEGLGARIYKVIQ